MEKNLGEIVSEGLEERARQIERNIEGIERKLNRKDVPEDKKRLLKFNLSKVCEALRVCQEDLSDFMRI